MLAGICGEGMMIRKGLEGIQCPPGLTRLAAKDALLETTLYLTKDIHRQPLFSGVATKRINELRQSTGNDARSEGEKIVQALLSCRRVIIYRELPPEKLKSTAGIRIMINYLYTSVHLCQSYGELWYYRLAIKTLREQDGEEEMDVKDVLGAESDRYLAKIIPPRWLVRQWEVVREDDGIDVLAPLTWESFEPLPMYKDTETPSFLHRLDLHRNYQTTIEPCTYDEFDNDTNDHVVLPYSTGLHAIAKGTTSKYGVEIPMTVLNAPSIVENTGWLAASLNDKKRSEYNEVIHQWSLNQEQREKRPGVWRQVPWMCLF